MRHEPVDAVITWVDGSDKIHAEKLANHLSRTSQNYSQDAVTPTRFNQSGEINYCLRSIFCYAPWVRTIYIVTDAQIPPIMNQLVGTGYENRVKLVDHREIFYGFEQYLPTFNSLTIEMVLWRISGLAENFIYFNDDCALIQPVSREDFFRENKVVLRGQRRVQSDKKLGTYLKKFIAFRESEIDSFRVVQENSAKLAGWKRYFFQYPHAPFPLRKKTFEDLFQQYPDAVEKNIQYALRDQKQFWIISWVQYLEMKHKNVVIDTSLKAVYINGACQSPYKIKHRLAQADKDNKMAFVCMQGLDEAPCATRSVILDWLEKRII